MNDGLIEIRDKKVVSHVRDSLNLELKDNFMVTPYVLGSVI